MHLLADWGGDTTGAGLALAGQFGVLDDESSPVPSFARPIDHPDEEISRVRNANSARHTVIACERRLQSDVLGKGTIQL